MEENWGETRGEEQKLEEMEEQPKDNGEPMPPSSSLPIPPPPPTPLPPPELIAIGVEQNRGEEQQSHQGGAAPIIPQSPPQNHRPVLEKVRGSHPSRQASIVDYTVNIPPQPTNTKVSGVTVSRQNVKIDMKR